MGKTLKPVTGSPTGVNMKQPRTHAAQAGGNAILMRPIMPMDTQALPNERFLQGRPSSMPRHINMMWAFGKQTFEGTLAYGPEGLKSPGRVQADTREIIKYLGGDYRGGRYRF